MRNVKLLMKIKPNEMFKIVEFVLKLEPLKLNIQVVLARFEDNIQVVLAKFFTFQ